MKKLFLVCCLFIVGILLFGCAQQKEDEIQLDEMKASEIVSVLFNLGYPVSGGKNYDETGDASQYPWNIPGCTSAAEFWIPNGSTDGESIGLIEVYNSVNACTTRRESFQLQTSAYDPYDYLLQAGKVFVQVPLILSKTAVTQYKSALQTMAQGKMPEPYLGAVSSDDKPSSQEVAAAQSVVEEYFRACKEKDSGAILKTLTPEHNRPNTFLFGEETKTLLTIDYNPEDSERQTYITSGRGSFNDIREENVIVFRVSFNIEYPEGVIGAWNEGKYENWSIILIRDDKDSPWLIDDQGW